MRKHWALWLVLSHVIITSVFVVKEEVGVWRYWSMSPTPAATEPFPRWITVLNAWAHGVKPPSPPPSDEWAEFDYWPSWAIKGYYIVEFPVALLIGWYQHPLALGQSPPLPLWLFPGTHHLQVHTRMLVLDTVMIAIVGLHWWAVAWVLRRKERLARWVKFPIIAITAGGGVCVLGGLLLHETVALLAIMGVLIGWMWALGASAAYVVWSTYLWGSNRLHPKSGAQD